MGEEFYIHAQGNEDRHVAEQRDRLGWSVNALERYQRTPLKFAAMTGTVTLLSSLGAFWFGVGIFVEDIFPFRVVLGVAIAQGIVAAMFVQFAGLIGIGQARMLHEEARASAGGGDPAEASAGNRQALIGLMGTIITAVLAFLGVLFQVFYGSGGGG
jgi:hypothetical protein